MGNDWIQWIIIVGVIVGVLCLLDIRTNTALTAMRLREVLDALERIERNAGN